MSFNDSFPWLNPVIRDFDLSISPTFPNHIGLNPGTPGLSPYGYVQDRDTFNPLSFPCLNSIEDSSFPASTISYIDPRVLYDDSSIESTPATSTSSSPAFTPPTQLYNEIVAEDVAAVSENWPRVASGSRVTLDRDGSEEYQESEGNGTDDEYLPSPVLRPVKTKTKAKATSKAKAKAKATSKGKAKPNSRGASASTRTQGRSRTAPYPTASPSRNPPAKTRQMHPSEDNLLQCPHCPHYQKNGRIGDLRRHIRTHFGKKIEEWVCCGLPSMDGIVDRVHNGVPYAEGCGTTFTRRDALRRHILHQGCATGLENLSHCRVLNA